MIFVLLISGLLHAGELQVVKGKFISYNEETIAVKTKEGKLIRVPLNKQNSDFIKSMDKLLGKEVLVHK